MKPTKFQKIKKRVIKIAVLILIVVFVSNTAFFVLLKSSNFNNIIYTYIQDNKATNDILDDIKSINYIYFGLKNYSWTGRRTTITFDIKVNTSNSICTMKVVMEKRNNTWMVLNIEKQK